MLKDVVPDVVRALLIPALGIKSKLRQMFVNLRPLWSVYIVSSKTAKGYIER